MQCQHVLVENCNTLSISQSQAPGGIILSQSEQLPADQFRTQGEGSAR